MCSFNVNGRPPNGDIEEWILGKRVHRKSTAKSLEPLDDDLDTGSQLHSSADPESPVTACEADDSATLNGSEDQYPDMIIVSFQEMDLSTEGLLYATAASASKGDAWISAISEALSFSEGGSYLKVNGQLTDGIRLLSLLLDSIETTSWAFHVHLRQGAICFWVQNRRYHHLRGRHRNPRRHGEHVTFERFEV